MRAVYRKGDPVSSCYLIESGKFYVQFGEESPVEFDCCPVIAGSIEYFLKDEYDKKLGRLFTLFVAPDTKLKTVSFDIIESMKHRYDFGFNANIFVARILKQSNIYAQKTLDHAPEEINQYHFRAKLYARLLNRIQRFGEAASNAQLLQFAEAEKRHIMYTEGATLLLEQNKSIVPVPPKPVKEFIVSFPKASQICHEGEAAKSMYVLLEGKIGVKVSGRYVNVIEEPGEAFGELSLFLRENRSAELIAEERSLLYDICPAALAEFHASHQNVFEVIGTTNSQRTLSNLRRVQRLEHTLPWQDETHLEKASKRRVLSKKGTRELRELYERFNTLQDQLAVPEIKKWWNQYSRFYAGDEVEQR